MKLGNNKIHCIKSDFCCYTALVNKKIMKKWNITFIQKQAGLWMES